MHSIEDINTEIQKLDEQYQRIASAVYNAQEKATSAAAQLPELKAQLGATLLRTAMQEMTAADVSAARFAIRHAERQIESVALIEMAAKKAQVGITGTRYKLSLRRGYRRDLSALQGKIAEAKAATETEIAQMYELCAAFGGDRAEVDTFVANLRHQAA